MQTLSVSASHHPQAPPGSPAIPSPVGQAPLLQQQSLLPSVSAQSKAAEHDIAECMSHGKVYTCAGSALCSLSHAVYTVFIASVLVACIQTVPTQCLCITAEVLCVCARSADIFLHHIM